MTNFLYRYEDQTYSLGVDQFDDPLPGYNLKLELRSFKVLRETPKGVWIEAYSVNGERFVKLGTRKQYAHLTKEDAKTSYLFRKRKQIMILSGQLEKAERALQLGENLTNLDNHETKEERNLLGLHG